VPPRKDHATVPIAAPSKTRFASRRSLATSGVSVITVCTRCARYPAISPTRGHGSDEIGAVRTVHRGGPARVRISAVAVSVPTRLDLRKTGVSGRPRLVTVRPGDDADPDPALEGSSRRPGSRSGPLRAVGIDTGADPRGCLAAGTGGPRDQEPRSELPDTRGAVRRSTIDAGVCERRRIELRERAKHSVGEG
jgi:hypothetical protein